MFMAGAASDPGFSLGRAIVACVRSGGGRDSGELRRAVQEIHIGSPSRGSSRPNCRPHRQFRFPLGASRRCAFNASPEATLPSCSSPSPTPFANVAQIGREVAAPTARVDSPHTCSSVSHVLFAFIMLHAAQLPRTTVDDGYRPPALRKRCCHAARRLARYEAPDSSGCMMFGYNYFRCGENRALAIAALILIYVVVQSTASDPMWNVLSPSSDSEITRRRRQEARRARESRWYCRLLHAANPIGRRLVLPVRSRRLKCRSPPRKSSCVGCRKCVGREGLFRRRRLALGFIFVAQGAADGLLMGLTLAAWLRTPTWSYVASGLRVEKVIEKSLPDTLDLLTVTVEAGLAFDAAVAQVTANTDGALAGSCNAICRRSRSGCRRERRLNRYPVERRSTN